MGELTKAQRDVLSDLAGASYGTKSRYFLGFPPEALLTQMDAAGLIDAGDFYSDKPVAITDLGRAALASVIRAPKESRP